MASNSEPRPVSVIHGIAIRGSERFDKMTAKLNAAIGEHVRLIPVYWGDLGASPDYLEHMMGRDAQRSSDGVTMVADAMRGTVASGVGRTLSWFQHQFGEADQARLTRAVGSHIRKHAHRRMRGYLNERFRQMRLLLTSAVLPVMADTIVYQSPVQRQRIHDRVRSIIDDQLPGHGTADRPVDIIGHSLGGVIAFDMAVEQDNPLCINRLVTMGSQCSLFHVLDPRPGVLEPFEGTRVTLPPTIHAWQNLWDIHDMLGFSADQVFKMHDGSLPQEIVVRCYFTALEGAAFFQSHVGYWQRTPAIRRLRDIFEPENEPA